MKKKYVLIIIVIACFLVFNFIVSGVSGLIAYLALFVIGTIIGIIINEIRNSKGGGKR